jgi:hypothetical protein
MQTTTEVVFVSVPNAVAMNNVGNGHTATKSSKPRSEGLPSTMMLDSNRCNFTYHQNQDSRQRQGDGDDHIYIHG